MTPYRNRVSPLTQRMAEDMLVRNLSPRTIDTYTYHVDKFTQHFDRPAKELGPEEIREYQLQLRVGHGKGSKERLVPMSPRLLEALRAYWKQVRPPIWLFPGKTDDVPLSTTTVQKACKAASREAGIRQRVSPHTLRHSYATGLLEAGVDLLTIGQLLGHKSFITTMVYLHVRRPHLQSTPSPIDWLPVRQCPRWLPETTPQPPDDRRNDSARSN